MAEAVDSDSGPEMLQAKEACQDLDQSEGQPQKEGPSGEPLLAGSPVKKQRTEL